MFPFRVSNLLNVDPYDGDESNQVLVDLTKFLQANATSQVTREI